MLHRKAILTVLALILGLSVPTCALERVAAKTAYWEIGFSYAMPQGSYAGIPGMDFTDESARTVSIDGANLYEDGFAARLGYGKIVGGKWLLGVTFDYARNQMKNPIVQTGYEPLLFPETNTYSHYAVVIRPGYAPLDLKTAGWSPFVGTSFSFGLAALTAPTYSAEYEATFGMDLDFGLDIKIWQSSDDRSYVTLASMNSWNFLATGNRVSHLQIGGGLRYFFKP